MLNTEAMTNAKVSYGTIVDDIKEIDKLFWSEIDCKNNNES